MFVDSRFLLRFLDRSLILGNSHVLYHLRITWTVFSREFPQVAFNTTQVPPKQTVITHIDALQWRQDPTHPTTLGWPCQPLKHHGNDRFVHRFSEAKILYAVFWANVLGCHATHYGCGSFDVPLNLILWVLMGWRLSWSVTLVCVTHVRPALVSVTLQILNKNLYFVLHIPVVTEEKVWSWRYFFLLNTAFFYKGNS